MKRFAAVVLPTLFISSALASVPSLSAAPASRGTQTAAADQASPQAKAQSDAQTQAQADDSSQKSAVEHEVTDRVRSSDAHPSRGAGHERKQTR